MKYQLLFVALLALFTSFGQNSFISGEFDNPNSNYVILSIPASEYGKEPTRLDSIILKKGKFKTSIQLDSTTEINLFDGKEYAIFTLQPKDEIHIYANAPIFDESLIFSGKGSKRNNLLNSVVVAKELLTTQLNSMPIEIPFSDTTKYYEGYDKSVNAINSVVDEGVKSYPEISDQLKLQKRTLTMIMNNFKYRKKFEIAMYHMKSSTSGKSFLDFEAVDLKGKTKTLKDFLGKPIIIDFWATWCGPCKREMPYLKEIEEEFKGKINVLSLNVYDDKAKWKKQAKGLGAQESVHLSKEKFQILNQEYMISYIPRFMILDGEGKIIDINASRPSKNLKTQIESILR